MSRRYPPRTECAVCSSEAGVSDKYRTTHQTAALPLEMWPRRNFQAVPAITVKQVNTRRVIHLSFLCLPPDRHFLRRTARWTSDWRSCGLCRRAGMSRVDCSGCCVASCRLIAHRCRCRTSPTPEKNIDQQMLEYMYV